MTFTHALATNNYGPAKFIVSSSAANGTHTTIASALTAASSGDTIFIRTGTYTENLTLKAGVNLTAYSCDAFTPNVTIVGKCTATFTGTASISGIRLQTNSDYCIEVSGSSATDIKIINCYILASNNTAINYSSSSASASLMFHYCYGDITTTGIAYFTKSSPGNFKFWHCSFFNSGSSTTASSISGLLLDFQNSFFYNSITNSGASPNINNTVIVGNLTTSSAATFNGSNSVIGILTTAGTGGGQFKNCSFDGDTATAISIGSGTTVTLDNCYVQSSNTNPISGAGTLQYNDINLSSTTGTLNPTTITGYVNYTGISRSPNQPSFFAYLGSNDLNKTGNAAVYTLGNSGTALTEQFDQGSNFNPTTGTFTAPLTGRYQFNAQITYSDLAAGATDGYVQIDSSNLDTFFGNINAGAMRSTPNNYCCIGGSILMSLTAGDTVNVRGAISGLAGNTVDILGGSGITSFSGQLLA